MHWGHARTKDFVTWEELPVALYPDRDYDSNGCWSGTAIEKDGVLYLYDGGKDAFLVESESDLDDLAEAVPNPGIMAFTDGFADIWTLGADLTWTSAK